jgi:hypothetical protein
MIGEGKCSGCGQQKRLWYEITVGEKTKNKYVKNAIRTFIQKSNVDFVAKR